MVCDWATDHGVFGGTHLLTFLGGSGGVRWRAGAVAGGGERGKGSGRCC